MLTYFLFVQHFEQGAVLSIGLDAHGQTEKPLQMRAFNEIRTLQENARTIIIFPSIWCGIYKTELPLLPEHKAREAIPFALEDRLAQPVNKLHFVFDKAHYQSKHYLIVVIEKQIMSNWMSKLQQLDIKYDLITIDWFAIEHNEACVFEEYIGVNTESFQGSLSLELWPHSMHEWATIAHWQYFEDSPKLENSVENPQNSGLSYAWIAARILNTKVMNLCQGEFLHMTSQTQVKRWYQITGYLLGMWFLVFVGAYFTVNRMIAHQAQLVDKQIAQSYHVFFPEAQQIINPKVRIGQLLKQNQMSGNASIWSLLDNLSYVLAQDFHGVSTAKDANHGFGHVTRVESLQFQNQTLTVTLVCDSFVALEKIEDVLRQRHIKVQQLSASTEKDQVIAKLELTI